MPTEVHQRLRSERDGIMRWIIDGLKMYRLQGLHPAPEAVSAATEAYRAEMDPLRDWLADECEFAADAMMASSAVRRSYETHCKDSGRQALGATRFNEELTRLGLDADRDWIEGKRHRVRRGIRLR